MQWPVGNFQDRVTALRDRRRTASAKAENNERYRSHRGQDELARGRNDIDRRARSLRRMNTGPAVRRGDEWFGNAINIAAPVASLAGPGEVLLTAATAEAITGEREADLIDNGLHRLRHVSEPVRLYRALSPLPDLEQSTRSVDTLCHM